MPSSSPPTSYSSHLPFENVTMESYNTGYTMLCTDSVVSTYISALNSWTTFTPATCSYNRSLTATTNPSPTLAITITSTEITTASPQETPLNDVSTVTEFSSTAITTTVTRSVSTSSQTSNAPKGTLEFGPSSLSGVTGLGWILYFSYKLLHR
ncbi:hypothetical protein OCU04_005536 [Sclerotinia nivalis]|uniref:Uncharacterized protein n=1 Tax=Sclerotinia nivalis TaxID=352851 RepID=A0A9X0APC0_9HELO|nr:hypothetical protein OCU04_005536 [Sclerotinia nivalis]